MVEVTQADRDAAGFDLTVMHRSELEGWIVHQANIIDQFRGKLGTVVLGIEDEGDRVYFGSTNHADWLREIEGEMLYSLAELEMPWMNGRDLFADLRQLREERDRMAAELAEAGKKLMPYLEWTISGECPGCHPTMPSAVAEFRAFLARHERTSDDQG